MSGSHYIFGSALLEYSIDLASTQLLFILMKLNRCTHMCTHIMCMYVFNLKARGWGDPHITTTDGRRYTFNGLGEYVLLRTNVSNFEFQGRTMVADNSRATIFSAFALTDGVDVIEVLCMIKYS